MTARKKKDLCAACHDRPRAGDLLCETCRTAADTLIARLPRAEALVKGSGPWDRGPA